MPADLPAIELGLPGWRLRPWRPEDAPSLAANANDSEVSRWMSDGFPHPYTLAIAEEWVARGHIDFGGKIWAICCDDVAVGGGGIHRQDGPLRCNLEVGWWLGRAHWGRGVATRAAATLVAVGFADPGITRVFAPIHAGNRRSMRVAEKNGFVLEGVQRQGAVKDGQVIDRWIYARYRG